MHLQTVLFYTRCVQTAFELNPKSGQYNPALFCVKKMKSQSVHLSFISSVFFSIKSVV